MRRTVPEIDRFMRKIKKDENTGCWNWIAAKDSSGYGIFVRTKNGETKREVIGAHRFSWIKTNGAIPDGLCVLHECDNPGCVNPKHLIVGTKKKNRNDAIARGRIGKGSKFVLGVREMLSSGVRVGVIASVYGVDQSTISHIKSGRTYSAIREDR